MAQRGTMIGMKSIIILFIYYLHESQSRTYEIIDTGGPYIRASAQAACQSQYGTDLATIISEADATEALRVANTISASFFIWIGLNDLDTEGTYVFEDGTACDDFCPQIWKENEPDNYNGIEDCAWIRTRDAGAVAKTDMVNDGRCNHTNIHAAMCNAPVTSNPSAIPSTDPTASPVLTLDPSTAPVTSNPSAYPTASPGATLDPSAAPVTSNPSADPSANPTASPDATSNPSVAPVTSSRRYEIIVPHPPYTRPLAQAACQSQYGTDLATIVSEADATEASEQHAMISVLKYGKKMNQIITMGSKTVLILAPILPLHQEQLWTHLLHLLRLIQAPILQHHQY
eukprot:595782_1